MMKCRSTQSATPLSPALGVAARASSGEVKSGVGGGENGFGWGREGTAVIFCGFSFLIACHDMFAFVF